MNDRSHLQNLCCSHWPTTASVLVRTAALWGVVFGGLVACGKLPPLTADAPLPAARLGPVQSAAQAVDHKLATQEFMTHALNALLVPLLDDDDPPRWADPSLSLDCDAGRVTVNDAPLDIGAPIPQGTFTVRWTMQRCVPFGDLLELTGNVELTVESNADNFTAVVQPVGFRVVSPHGEAVLNEPFVRHMRAGH